MSLSLHVCIQTISLKWSAKIKIVRNILFMCAEKQEWRGEKSFSETKAMCSETPD